MAWKGLWKKKTDRETQKQPERVTSPINKRIQRIAKSSRLLDPFEVVCDGRDDTKQKKKEIRWGSSLSRRDKRGDGRKLHWPRPYVQSHLQPHQSNGPRFELRTRSQPSCSSSTLELLDKWVPGATTISRTQTVQPCRPRRGWWLTLRIQVEQKV